MTPLITAAAILALALWVALAVQNRHAALVVLVALLPTYLFRFSIPIPGVGITLPSTLFEILLLSLFAVWLLTDGRRTDAWDSLREWALPVTLFLTASLVSVMAAPDTMSAAGLWRAYTVEPIMFFVMFTDILRRRKRGTSVLAALGALLALVGIIAIYQKITGFGIPNPVWAAAETRRVTAFYGFPNAIGLLAAPVAVLMIAWSANFFEARKYLAAALAGTTALLGVAGIIFAVSEGAAVGLLAGLIIYGLVHRGLRPWALAAVIAACLAVMTVVPLRDYVSLLASLRDDSGQVRRVIWSETAVMLADNPVFGAGLSGYPGRILPYHHATWIEVFQYPHNLIMNFWSEVGLLGLAGFIWVVAQFYAAAARLMRSKNSPWLASALVAAMTALLVHGLVDVPYFKNDLAILFWIIVGLAEVQRQPQPTGKDMMKKFKTALETLLPEKS